MYLAIHKKGFSLTGKVKDLKQILAGWPANMTLLDFVRLNIH